MDDGQERGEVRVESTPCRESRQIAKRASGSSEAMRASRRGFAVRALRPRNAPPASPKVYLADLFGGTGGAARHATQLGLQGRVWDVCLSPHLDITLPRCRHVLVQDAHAGLLQAVMLAPECRSWSNARARTNAIRSKTEPWGVAFPSKPFTANDIAALESGNRQVRAVIGLSDPRSSYLWATTKFLKLASQPQIETRRID